ncbi:MAG TPA: hypothetical protein VLF09_05915 [Cellvibrio sp.]|nr:hypothetical protein [Cellvibrio sp.]
MADLSRLKADIDFVKTLAVEAGQVPLNAGFPLFLAGLVFGAAALLHYAAVLAVSPFAGLSSFAIWGTAMLVYAVVGIGWGMKNRAALKVQGNKNRVVGAVWGGIGFSIFLFSVTLAILSYRLQSAQLGVFMMPVVLVLYGLGWIITAEVSAQRWMTLIGVGCFIVVPLVAWMSLRPEQLLLYALALVCSALIPGWLLMTKEKALQ